MIVRVAWNTPAYNDGGETLVRGDFEVERVEAEGGWLRLHMVAGGYRLLSIASIVMFARLPLPSGFLGEGPADAMGWEG